MIGRASSWILGLLTLLKLHSYALVSLLIGAYFMGISQPGREFWAQLLSQPSPLAWVLTLLAATLWVLSLAWTTARAQQAFEHDRVKRLGSAWPFAAPSVSQGLTRLALWVPSLFAGCAVFAIAIGWGSTDSLTQSERVDTAVAALFLFPMCGSVASVYLFNAWRKDVQGRPRALRIWGIWQGALVLLTVLLLPTWAPALTSIVTAAAVYMYLRRHPGAQPVALVGWISVRVVAIALTFLSVSQEAQCLLHANWLDSRPAWDHESAVEPSGCRWLDDQLRLQPGELMTMLLVFVAGAALMVVLEWLAFWCHRALAKRHDATSPRLDAAVAVLPIVVGCALFGGWAVPVGGFLGTLPVVLIALAVWTIFLTWLFIQLPIRAGIGAWPLALPAWLLVVSPWTDNHRMEEALAQVQAKPPRQIATAPAACLGNPHPLLCQRYVDWAAHRPPSDAGRPAFLVVTSGGGVRAAYWTALVLAKLDDNTCGEFSRNTFAISGVSGGSVGATVFVAAARQARESGMRPTAPSCASEKSLPVVTTMIERFFEHDLMAPLVGSMLFPDALQRFLPAWVPWGGRGRAFEAALEHAGRESLHTDTLSEAFWSLYRGDAGLKTPLLMLASTSTRNGFRAVSSAVDPQDPLAHWLQSPAFATENMRLSTAAHNSARFPLVSPPGRIEDHGENLMLRVVDGGYFENSSASTGRTALRAMSAPARASQTPVHIILIENDPQASPDNQCRNPKSEWVPSSAAVDEWNGPTSFAFELGSVIGTLLDTRSARAPWHQSELGQMTCDSQGLELSHAFLKDWDKHRAQEPEPAMSWYLAESTKATMRNRASEETAWSTLASALK